MCKYKNGKLCNKCSQVKTIDNFSINKKTSKYRSNCKDCEVQKSKEYRIKYPEKVKEQKSSWSKSNPDSVKKTSIRNNLKKWNYQKNIEETVEKILNQEICDCCGNKFERLRDKHMDHCHLTNNYRGTICRSCNHILGHCKDNEQILQSCIQYLLDFKQNLA
jgi:hypothetical protein